MRGRDLHTSNRGSGARALRSRWRPETSRPDVRETSVASRVRERSWRPGAGSALADGDQGARSDHDGTAWRVRTSGTKSSWPPANDRGLRDGEGAAYGRRLLPRWPTGMGEDGYAVRLLLC